MHVKQALLAVEGVEDAQVDLQRGEAVVQGGDMAALVRAVEGEGYSARPA